MKKIQRTIIIGVDHGYGNTKTANCIFQSGVVKLKEGQEFAQKPLIYKNEKYLVGQGHKVFVADKFLDEDYYILTLGYCRRVVFSGHNNRRCSHCRRSSSYLAWKSGKGI